MRRKESRSLYLCVLCLMSVSMMAQRYTVTDLGPIVPTGINSWAQVAGNYNNRGYLWTLGRMRSVGTLPGGTFSYAAGINDLGVVVGTADGHGTVVPRSGWGGSNVECSDLTQPFVWKKQMQGLGTVGPVSDVEGTLPPIAWCGFPFYGSAINDAGQVVGDTVVFPDEFQWDFLWTKSEGISIFGSSFPPTFARGISNTGQIVGENGIYFGNATEWKNGVANELEGLPGFLDSSANAVNDLGEIAGWSTTSMSCTPEGCFFPLHAVIWNQGGKIRDLGTLSGDTYSSATAINLFGLVIGSSGNTVSTSTEPGASFPSGPLEVIGRPFIWSRGTGMRDLNTLIRQNSGWVLNTATAINVWGQIVGSGTRNGQPHGYLLTPLNPFQVF